MGTVDVCRLCANNVEFSKDLLDDSNRDLFQLVIEFVKITITATDNLPTKVCFVCEETMLSFNNFIINCTKAQDSLQKWFFSENSDSLEIKLEHVSENDIPDIKSELHVKAEFTEEDTPNLISNDEALSDEGFDPYIEDKLMHAIEVCTLKPVKKKRLKRRLLTDEETTKFSEILKQSNLNIKDIVHIVCDICKEECENWTKLSSHCARTHKTKPVVYCMCGIALSSKSVLYKHVSDHKLESKKLQGFEVDETNTEYNTLNVRDFVNFQCHACERKFPSWYRLAGHTARYHKEGPIVYCICGVSIKSKSVLYKHVADHKHPNIYTCDRCPKVATNSYELEKHKMRHIPKKERIFKCDICNKIFNSKEALKSHHRSHIPIEERKVYHCEICNMKFTTQSSVLSHKKIVHEKLKRYICDLCGYACGTNGELRQHRAIHSDDKPFVCGKCSKPFKTYSNLKTHMDIHDDTSYVCYVCNRILNSRRTLRKHLLVHDEKCRHVCSYCNKAFKRRQTLKVHLYTHTGDKPLSCKWCEEKFSYASTLRSHKLRCHPEKLTIPVQSNSYLHDKNLVQELHVLPPIHEKEFVKEEEKLY